MKKQEWILTILHALFWIGVLLTICLTSCNVWDKIAGTAYWDEVCIEPYAYYDSSNQMPRKFMKTARMIVYVTDSTNTKQCNIIWGDECGFIPGEMLYVRWHRAHSPSSGTGGWKATLINHDEHLIYTLYE